MQRPECVVLDEGSFAALLGRIDASNLPPADIALVKISCILACGYNKNWKSLK